MTLVQLLAPIALATVVNVFLFALFWRANQQEERVGATPWYLYVGLFAYSVPLALFVYTAMHRPLVGYFDLFATAVASEAFGAMIVYALLNAFLWTRGQPMRDRAGPMGLSLFLLVLMIGVAFA